MSFLPATMSQAQEGLWTQMHFDFLLERLILYFLESITFSLPMPDVVREYSFQIEMSKQAKAKTPVINDVYFEEI